MSIQITSNNNSNNTSRISISATVDNSNNNNKVLKYTIEFNISSGTVDNHSLLLYLLRVALVPITKDPNYNITRNIDNEAKAILNSIDNEIDKLLEQNQMAKTLISQMKAGTLNPFALMSK
jgi:hypothetical protein